MLALWRQRFASEFTGLIGRSSHTLLLGSDFTPLQIPISSRRMGSPRGSLRACATGLSGDHPWHPIRDAGLIPESRHWQVVKMSAQQPAQIALMRLNRWLLS